MIKKNVSFEQGSTQKMKMHVDLNLLIDDTCTFLNIAAAHGMSPVQMIERFIHDTVRGSETTVEFMPGLAEGYAKEISRHNPDGSFKFPVFILEQYDIDELFLRETDIRKGYDEPTFRRDFMASWIEGDGEGRGYATTDYWSAYQAYCQCMREQPETIEQAITDLVETASIYALYIDNWETVTDEDEPGDGDPERE